jgi:hypothetical protein
MRSPVLEGRQGTSPDIRLDGSDNKKSPADEAGPLEVK